MLTNTSEEPGSKTTYASSRNRLACKVHEIAPQDGVTQVTLCPRDKEDGPYLKAVITRHSERDLELKKGSLVYALIKATALHTFEVSPGESNISPAAERS